MAATTISDLARPSLAKGVRSHEILSRCDGRTLGEIICELAEEYEADSNALAADVRNTLSDLQQRKLIEFK